MHLAKTVIFQKVTLYINPTEEDADGPKFPEEVERYLLDTHFFVIDHLDEIEEIVHQMILKGGVKVGTYKCKDWQRIWSYEG